jgi:hypothetical protein
VTPQFDANYHINAPSRVQFDGDDCFSVAKVFCCADQLGRRWQHLAKTAVFILSYLISSMSGSRLRFMRANLA